MTSVLRQTSAFMAHEKPVVGDMKMSFVGYNHLGWMMCNGASLLIATNQLLYKVIGKQFGSVDAAHFNLPNPAGRVAGVVGYNSIIGTIVPGSVMMTAIGALAGVGVIPLWRTIIWAILGAIAGDGISYWLGRRFNERLPGIWPFRAYPNLLENGEAFFRKYPTCKKPTTII